MKKKFKLFATIGSLALAVCMMTIGVLAASQVSLTVNSTVTFSAESVYVTVAGEMSGGTQGTKTFTAKNYTGTAGDSASSGDFTGTGVTSNAYSFENATYSESAAVITYKFTITNDGALPAYVKVTVNDTTVTNPALTKGTLTVDGSSTAADCDVIDGTKSLATDENVVVTYTLTLNNFSASVTDGNTVSFSIQLSNKTIA